MSDPQGRDTASTGVSSAASLQADSQESTEELQKTDRYFAILDKAMLALGKVDAPISTPTRPLFALDAIKPELPKLKADEFLEEIARKALVDPTRVTSRRIPPSVSKR